MLKHKSLTLIRKFKLVLSQENLAKLLRTNGLAKLDQSILDKVVAIQKLPEEDKTCIMYSLNGLIQHAKTRLAYQER